MRRREGGKNITENLSSLSPQEREIFDLLIVNTAPKEIGFALNINYNTVLYHQKKIYKKLHVNCINELIDNYVLIKNIPVNFSIFSTFVDNDGSSINLLVSNEEIGGETFTTYKMSGSLFKNNNWPYAGINGIPAHDVFTALRKTSSFVFKVFGDGKIYNISVPTTDTVETGDHYGTTFTTAKDKEKKITVNLNEIVKVGWSKTSIPFIKKNITSLQFAPFENGPFNLKIWDIRLNT